MKVSFFIRGNKLQVRVPYNGTYLRLSTGLKTPEHTKFVVSRQAFTGTSQEAKFLNSEIERHRSFIQDVVRSGYDLKKEYDNFTKPMVLEEDLESYEIHDLCQRYISMATSGKLKKKDGNIIKPSTLRAYRFAVNTLINYKDMAGTIDLLEYNLSNITDVQKKRQIGEKWKRYFDGLIDYMRLHNFKINTRSQVMLGISIMVKHYSREFYLMLPPVPSVKGVDNPIIVLPDGFISTFLNDGKYDKLQGDMRLTWEVCATIMVTTMRIIDAVSLKWEDFNETSEGLFLGKYNAKTGATTNMIIPRQLAMVFKENMARHGKIYTPSVGVTQGVVYNNITKLFAMYPELHVPVSANMVDVRGEMVNVTMDLYEWVKPHMLRKTAITTMLNKGIPEQHVKFASGHSVRSESFEKYRAFVDRNFNNELSKYYANF